MSMSEMEIWWDTFNHMVSVGIVNDEDELALSAHVQKLVDGFEKQKAEAEAATVDWVHDEVIDYADSLEDARQRIVDAGTQLWEKTKAL